MPPLVYTAAKADTPLLSPNGSQVLGFSLSDGRTRRPESLLADEGLDFTSLLAEDGLERLLTTSLLADEGFDRLPPLPARDEPALDDFFICALSLREQR